MSQDPKYHFALKIYIFRFIFIKIQEWTKNCETLTLRDVLLFTEVIWAVGLTALRTLAPPAGHRILSQITNSDRKGSKARRRVSMLGECKSVVPLCFTDCLPLLLSFLGTLSGRLVLLLLLLLRAGVSLLSRTLLLLLQNLNRMQNREEVTDMLLQDSSFPLCGVTTNIAALLRSTEQYTPF